jgi:hypothetical protein
MDHCLIYDKMRLFLQREGRNREAVKFGVFSHLCELQGLFFQNSHTQLETEINKRLIRAIVDDLLKKAEGRSEPEKIVELIVEEIRNLPDIDFNMVAKRIAESM